MVLHVDRTTFLSLAFGMAGVACNSHGQAVSASVVELPVQPPPQASGSSAAPVASSAAPASSTGSHTLSSAKPVAMPEIDEDGEFSGPSFEGSFASASASASTQNSSCGWVEPSSVSRPSGACNDDQGAAPTCAVMKRCQGFAFPQAQCRGYRANFKPKVAKKALECLAKLSSTEVCDACTTYRCGDLALKTACPDPTAEPICRTVTSRCSAVSMDECKLYMSGLNATGRAKLSTCLTSKQGCGYGIFSCTEGL